MRSWSLLRQWTEDPKADLDAPLGVAAPLAVAGVAILRGRL